MAEFERTYVDKSLKKLIAVHFNVAITFIRNL